MSIAKQFMLVSYDILFFSCWYMESVIVMFSGEIIFLLVPFWFFMFRNTIILYGKLCIA